MILPYQVLMERGTQGELVVPFDPALVNPASIDIRIGLTAERHGKVFSLAEYTKENPYWLRPRKMLLVSTLERLRVPVDCAMDLRVKSSRAREGYNHVHAFWFDPGWDGVGTLEVLNEEECALPLYPGLRFGQIIYYQLSAPCAKPYAGRYQGANQVEGSKG